MTAQGPTLAQGDWATLREGLTTAIGDWRPLTSANADRVIELVIATANVNGTTTDELTWHIVPSGTELAIWFADICNRTNVVYVSAAEIHWVPHYGIDVPSAAKINHVQERPSGPEPMEYFPGFTPGTSHLAGPKLTVEQSECRCTPGLKVPVGSRCPYCDEEVH